MLFRDRGRGEVHSEGLDFFLEIRVYEAIYTIYLVFSDD